MTITAVYKAATPAGTWSRAAWLELGVVLALPVLVFVLLVPVMVVTRSPGKSPLASLLMPGGTALLCVGLILGLRAAGRRLVYLLDEDGLTICIGPFRERIPIGTITGVRVASPPGSPRRVYGVDLPNFLWGRFTWVGVGRSLKLYATRKKPLVCIDTRICTYGITPADAEVFVADLQRRIGSGARPPG